MSAIPPRAECAARVAWANGVRIIDVERAGFFYGGRYFEPLPDIVRRITATYGTMVVSSAREKMMTDEFLAGLIQRLKERGESRDIRKFVPEGSPDHDATIAAGYLERLSASLSHAVVLMEESGCFKGQDLSKLLGIEPPPT